MLLTLQQGVVRYWNWVKSGGLGRKVVGIGGPLLMLSMMLSLAGGSESSPTDTPTQASNNAVYVTPPPSRPTEASNTLSASDYRRALESLSTRYSSDMSSMSALLNRASITPTLALDSAWKTELGQVIDRLRAHGAGIRALVPPACYSKTQSFLLTVATEHEVGLELLITGIYSLNTDTVLAGNQRLAAGNAALGEATSSMRTSVC